MSTPEQPNLDDVMEPTESASPDHSEHAKGYARPNDDALEHRTEQERQLVDSDDADPAGAEDHSAAE